MLTSYTFLLGCLIGFVIGILLFGAALTLYIIKSMEGFDESMFPEESLDSEYPEDENHLASMGPTGPTVATAEAGPTGHVGIFESLFHRKKDTGITGPAGYTGPYFTGPDGVTMTGPTADMGGAILP